MFTTKIGQKLVSVDNDYNNRWKFHSPLRSLRLKVCTITGQVDDSC